MKVKNKPILEIKNLQLKQSEQLLQIDELTLYSGQNYLICGPNGSGKSRFAAYLHEQLPDSKLISFDLEQAIIEFERQHDDSEFVEGGFDPGRSAREIIAEENDVNEDYLIELCQLFNVEHVIDQAFQFLSTGETRKILIIKSLMSQPDVLILDEPYAGLDYESQANLTIALENLIASGTSIFIVGLYRQDLPAAINRILLLNEGRLVAQGSKEHVFASSQWKTLQNTQINLPGHLPGLYQENKLSEGVPLVDARSISLAYNGKQIFENLSWTMAQGEHWAIIGPNGAGKTSLLSMISGDNTKAYGQELYLFGVKRGSGESIWDIKKHIGIISGNFHRQYRVNMPAVKIVLSGFFDSIGLYERVTNDQLKVARQWLSILGLLDKEEQLFNKLSYGEQRLLLLARAMIKLPNVLILDEPCQGLDLKNEKQVLALIDFIAANSQTHILHVTHNKEEKLNCTDHIMYFIKQDNGVYTVKLES